MSALKIFSLGVVLNISSAQDFVQPEFFKTNASWPLVSLPASFQPKEKKQIEENNMHFITFTNSENFEVSIMNHGFVVDDGTAKSARDWVLINEVHDGSTCHDSGKYEVFVSPARKGIMQVIYLQKNPHWGLCFQVLEFKADFKLKKNQELADQIIKQVIPSFARELR